MGISLNEWLEQNCAGDLQDKIVLHLLESSMLVEHEAKDMARLVMMSIKEWSEERKKKCDFGSGGF